MLNLQTVFIGTIELMMVAEIVEVLILLMIQMKPEVLTNSK
jgi:hypothetical protein